jgi:DNA-binding XRE family transcriptional regulator
MKTEYQQFVINRIKSIRESRGITQMSFAKLLDISPGQMGNIDSYKQPHKYTIKQILTICDSFGINIEDVLFTDNDLQHGHTTREVVSAIIRYQEK